MCVSHLYLCQSAEVLAQLICLEKLVFLLQSVFVAQEKNEKSNKPAQMLRTEWHRRQSCDAHTPHVSCSLAQDLSSWAVSNESQAD